MEKLAGDLLLGLKLLEILSKSFIDILYDKLGEFRSRSLELKFVKLEILSTSFIDFLYGELRSRSELNNIVTKNFLQRFECIIWYSTPCTYRSSLKYQHCFSAAHSRLII